ncbi:MAG: HPr(Ser) kinase/phosphatase [Spirochaetaceae bacterium]|nr:HPr(Ser) kinase/phosphatase [Spirochaetaceae bacterium]
MANFTVFDLLAFNEVKLLDLKLSCVAGHKGLNNTIFVPEINRPSLALAGFYTEFDNNLIQVFGREEWLFLNHLTQEEQQSFIAKFLSFKLPCCIFTNNLAPPASFIALAEEMAIPILLSGLKSFEFSEKLFHLLSNTFAEQTSLHGVLVEVYGLGILVIGESGVGKSETVLDLIERGHRLVADDLVKIKKRGTSELIGSSAGAGKHLMELRGVGIINVANLYGLRAIQDKHPLDIVILLELWQDDKTYDRTGAAGEFYEILGLNLPLITVPVMPGRNIPILIESVALNERSRLRKKQDYLNFNI